ncbi:MAG: hypothetical protein E6G01_00055 [Actinobacteria bacterium]|nr:MAG: hypothetical protein E6G01_00055 [Actinomycetota bacterium]
MATDNEPHGVDRLIGDLRRWAADARASDAARARSRQRWLRRQAEEESTLAGIALNLAERGTAVVLETTSGHTHRGRLLGLARDVWLLRSGGSSVTFVAADAIAAFQAQPRGDGTPISEATGARPVPLAASLAEMLGDLAAERPRLRIVVRGRSDALTGQLRAVGMDVATVRLAGDPPTTVYVRLDSVSEVSVLGSG